VLGLPGCGNRVQPAPFLDAAMNTDPSSQFYGQVGINVAEYPDLAPIGGAVTVRVQNVPADATFFVPDGGVLLVHRDASGSDYDFVAVQSLCPHQQCPLGYSASNDKVECPCHGSQFLAAPAPGDPTSYAGQVTHLPARDDLGAWKCTVMGARVHIDFLTPLTGGVAAAAVVNGTVTIPIAMLPALATVGGSTVLSPTGLGDTLLLVRADAATVQTVSATCTHAACKVRYDAAGADLRCPCHGSTFTLDGAVTNGPATRALKSYLTDFDGTTIVVHVA
jgi:Rieske Fe-S protein